MPRNTRVTPGGMVFHVLNRGVGRRKLFRKPADYAAFESIMQETLDKQPIRICGYCLMPNHWHLVLWPENDGDLPRFLQRLTITHVTRWQKNRQVVGEGHLYQGRFKSFPVSSDEYFYQLLRYVERNALRANLCTAAEEWRWSSLWRQVYGSADDRAWLADWPLPRPSNWTRLVNKVETQAELDAIRRSVHRGQPYGPEAWVNQVITNLGLESTVRPRGRPRNC